MFNHYSAEHVFVVIQHLQIECVNGCVKKSQPQEVGVSVDVKATCMWWE